MTIRVRYSVMLGFEGATLSDQSRDEGESTCTHEALPDREWQS